MALGRYCHPLMLAIVMVALRADGGLAETIQEKVEAPETIQSYSRKVAPLMQEWAALSHQVVQAGASVGFGVLDGSNGVKQFEQFATEFTALKDRLTEFSPPPELVEVQDLLLKGAASAQVACQQFAVATEKNDKTLYDAAAKHMEESKQYLLEALDRLPDPTQ